MTFTGSHYNIIGNIVVFSEFFVGPEITFTDYLLVQSIVLISNVVR